MLYVFSGDTKKAKEEAKKLSKKAEIVLFGEGGHLFLEAPSYLGSGLFTKEVALIVDEPLETAEGRELLEKYGEELNKSENNVFVVISDLKVAEKKLFPRGTKFEKFESKTVKAPERPNMFAFTDAFLSGDKKKTWLGYRKLISSGISAEEIHGVLMWAIRSTLLSLKTNSAGEAGLKPFVYTKSKRAGEKLGEEKVENLSRELVAVYHRARAGEGEMELGLERMMLS